MKRSLSVLIAAALVGAAIVAPVGDAAAKKKKKKKKSPPVVACAPFAPGELGAEAETVTITDAATEEAPVEQTVSLAMSAADADLIGAVLEPTFDYFNVQVDSANPDAGLYVLFEFPERRDYDLELLHTDSSYAARSHDFNVILGAPNGLGENGGHGGEATPSSEKLVGIRTADCGGWTVEAVNWFGEGGDFTIKAWLGDVVNEPQAPGEEPHS